MRSEDGQFVAGASGNPGGRPRAVQQARDLIEALAPELVMTLMEIVRDRKVPARARVAAAMGLLDRRYGRPKQQVKWADGLILPLPDDQERDDEERGDEEPEEPCPPEPPAEPAADDAAHVDAAPDGDEPAAEPVAAAAAEPDPAVTSDAAVKQPGRPDEAPPRPSDEPAPSHLAGGGSWRFGMDHGARSPHAGPNPVLRRRFPHPAVGSPTPVLRCGLIHPCPEVRP